MKEIKILGWDCHVVLTLSALLAMTTMWACDGTEDGQSDADTCCDGDVQPDGTDDGEAVLATLTVESTPVSGATIAINGSDTGEVTPHSFEKAVGHYTVQLTLADYDAAPEEVDLPPEGTTVTVTLYPSVEGEWALTYQNTETGGEENHTLELEQTGDLLTGWDDQCGYTGSIFTTGEISLFRSNCGSTTSTITGSRTNSNHMEGNWYSSEGSSGIWWGDRR